MYVTGARLCTCPHWGDSIDRKIQPKCPHLQPWMNTTQGRRLSDLYLKRNPNFHRVDNNGTQLPYIDEDLS